MRALVAVSPVLSHLNPLLAIGSILADGGHDVAVLSGAHLRTVVERAGHRFVSLPPSAEIDYSRWAERQALPVGVERLRFDLMHGFLDPMPAQAAALRATAEVHRADVIVHDSFFFGATALFLDHARPRPRLVACGVSVMTADRADGAPAMMGFGPARTAEEAARYMAASERMEGVFGRPLKAHADATLAAMGLPPLPCSVLHSRHLLTDAFLQPGVPAFEYEAAGLPQHVRFIGALSPPASGSPPHGWSEPVDGTVLVVLTQGTVSNLDFGELVEPTLAALADRSDVRVLAITGHRPPSVLRGPVPDNARVTEYVDLSTLLPRSDLLVTNGGYGTVMLALRAGVPILAAGRSEDKAEVGARVAWSGVGLEIPLQHPSPDAIAAAVGQILGERRFRDRARLLACDMAQIDTAKVVARVIEDRETPFCRS